MRPLRSSSVVPLLSAFGLIGGLLGPIGDAVDDLVDGVGGAVGAIIDLGVLDDGRALVHAADGVHISEVVAAVDAAGGSVHNIYEAIGVVAVSGSSSALEQIAAAGGVARLERDAPVRLFTDTSHTATRGAELLDGSVTVGGTLVDGSGIGVAVVDSGVDELHPDFSGRVGENVKVLPLGIAIPLSISDLLSLGGHGTHVAGTIVGNGSASSGQFHGAATGATVHGVSAGVLISLAFALDGLEWVLDNHDSVSPAIRVVNNSWGSSGEHDPDSAVTQMVNALVAEGVTVVFAAGNAGGDGSDLQTSPECTNPTPGVVCVAAYDDLDQGTRDDGDIASFSSRGEDGRPETYPDLAAPGANIVAPCLSLAPICLTGALGSPQPLLYSSLSGTSMAAPHIAGIVAQMLQVAPQLTPAEVEQILIDTAENIGEPAFAQGAGLVDAVAAVLDAAAQ